MSKARNKSKVEGTGETVKDLMPETPDLNAERLAKLRELFPDLFTDEGVLSESELRKLVDPQSVNETERYEFRWFGKSDSKRKAFTPTRATLNYDKGRSVNPDTSQNLIIEGENLEVLKLLLCSYREQVKCIYIDPPYNTGKDFVYSDNYTEGREPYWKQIGVKDQYGVKVDTNTDSDGRFHSNWLNMMFSRLLVARQLLRKDGVIFISIDDNEVHNLRRLCNEVFGAENFVGNITVLCNPKGRSQDKYFATNHENVIVYSKDALPKGSFSIEKDEEQVANEYPESDEFGKYRLLELRNTHREFGKHNRKNLYYPLYINEETGEVSLNSNGESIKVEPIWDDNFKGCWTWDRNKVQSDNEYLVGMKNEKGKWKVYRKSYANGADKMCKTIFLDKSFHTEKGQKEFNTLFETKTKLFQSPKSVELIKLLIKTSSSEESFILDFFAGSGSTGQAVMELNEEDGGNRTFILVQLPELTDEKSEAYKAGYKHISDITIERNKRVVEKLIAAKHAEHPALFTNKNKKDALTGLGFKVFKLENSYFPRTEWNPDPSLSEADNVESLKKYIAEKESQLHINFDRDKLLIEILLKEGFKLSYVATPYNAVKTNTVLHISDSNKEALVCLDDSIEPKTVQHFKTHKDIKFICLERALDTTKKWNLHHFLGEKFKAL